MPADSGSLRAGPGIVTLLVTDAASPNTLRARLVLVVVELLQLQLLLLALLLLRLTLLPTLLQLMLTLLLLLLLLTLLQLCTQRVWSGANVVAFLPAVGACSAHDRADA